MTDWIAITEDEAAVLNAARDTLEGIKERARMQHDWNAGVVFAIAERAENNVFQTMNYASSYGHAELPAATLHNRLAKETA